MKRITFARLAVLTLAVVGLALQGCGGDDNGGISAADMARIDAAEAAAEAAAASAAAAEEAATMDDDMEMDDTSDLEDRIAALEEDDVEMPIGLPMLDSEKASVLTRDVNALSQDAEDYDVSMVDPTLASGASAMTGHYAGKAMTGFGGLDVTDAGGDGANVFGSWLQYSHWGVVETKSGRLAANRLAIFSVGENTGSNPMPIGGQMKATWSGSMVGSWDEAARQASTDADNDETMSSHANYMYLMEDSVGRSISLDTNGTVVEATATGAARGIDLPAMNVRGTAKLTVDFSQTAGGPQATADLAISGLSDDLGRFRPGVAQQEVLTGVDATTVISDSDHIPDPNSLLVWTDMEITAGDFARHDFNRSAGPDGIYVGQMLNPAGDAIVGTANENGLDDIHDRTGAMNYLAGRFYGEDGMEVGGVFMENGQISGADNTFGGAASATDPDNIPDMMGTLTGALGAARDIP